MCNGKGKNESFGSGFDNKAKGVSVFKSWGLMVAFGNKMSSIVIHETINSIFSFNPIYIWNVGIGWWMDEGLGWCVV